MSRFPDCFPEDFESRILPKDAEYGDKVLYRLALHGINSPDSYVPTIIDDERNNMPRRKAPGYLDKPSTYSTSCCIDYEHALDLKDNTFRNKPWAEIAVGYITSEQGPTKTNRERGHVDWWIYRDVKPELLFRKAASDDT